jgi:hypothetical protein
MLPQQALGQQPEDPLVRRGTVRLEIAPSYGWWSERYGERTENGALVKEKEPLAFDLTRDDVGVDMVPTLATFENRIAELLKDDDFALDLGTTSASWTYGQTRIPLRLDVGVTEWLTVSGMVPMIRTETLVDVSLRGDSTVANSGYNPSQDDPSAVNGFLSDLETDLNTFEGTVGQICTDLGPESPECVDATSLLAEGRSLDQSLSGLYQDANAFFPLTGTDAGRAVDARVDDLRSGLEAFGETPVFGTAPLSEAPADNAAFGRLVTDPAYGVQGAPLTPLVGAWGMGDAEFSVVARLLANTRAATPADSGFHYMLGGEATVRLATGSPADPDIFQTVDEGGRGGYRFRVFGSAQAGRRWGLWGHVAAGFNQSVDVTRRVSTPDVILAPAASRALVSWKPGNTLDIFLSPHFNLTPGLALNLPYRFFVKGEDTYTAPAPASDEGGATVGDVSVLNQETSVTLHRLGIGAIYSTLPAFRRDQSSFPMELRATWQASVGGGGGQTPVLHSLTVTFRLFLSFWGGGA